MMQQDVNQFPEYVQIILEALEDMKGINIKVLDVSKICNFTDWMILSTGRSARHVSAISEEVSLRYKKHSAHVPPSEGRENAEWVLVDCGDIVVHVMQDEARERYALEKLWT